MAIRVITALATILCIGVLPADAANVGQVGNFTLGNGLEVVVIPDGRTSMVTHMIWYKVGSADDPAGKSGLAHFLEHLMFRGTHTHPAGRFSKVVAMLGGHDNAFTNSDYTAYFQRIRREHLQTVMTFEADRMSNLALTDAEIEVERNVVLEEYNMRIGNSPASRLGEQLNARLYRDHSYGTPVIGWPQEIGALYREDVLAFYRRFYAPNNAVLIVAGNVSPDEVRRAAESTYGRIERRTDVQTRERPQPVPPVDIVEVTLADPRAQPCLRRSYLVPSYANAEPGVAEALDVLAYILGNGSTSRLYRAVVKDARVATWAGGSYEGSALGWSRFEIHTNAEPGVSFNDIEALLDAVISEIVVNGVANDELERAKTRMIADVLYARDSQVMLARSYGVALTTGTSIAQVQDWPERIRAVSADDVRDAARIWLDKARAVSGYLVKEVQASTEGRGEERS
jgi:zinc protease